MPDKRVLFLAAMLLCACTKAPEEGLSLPDPSLLSDLEDRAGGLYSDASAQLLAARDYADLDKLAATDRATENMGGLGQPPISYFYSGITCLPEAETVDAYKQRESELEAWSQARPDSVAAKIALAMTLTNDAWFARGSGYADTVSESGWTIFGKKLNQASEVLDSVKDKRQDYPEWYAAHCSIGLGLSEDKAAFLATALEGTTRFPKATDIYWGVEVYLLPRWFGSDQEVRDYVTQSADKIGGDEGDILYARLARNLWRYAHDINPFAGTGLSWPRVRHGMQLICNRYPTSTASANYFCLFAWQAQDHAAANILFNYLGDHYTSGVWASREDFDKARAWAQ